MPTASFGTCTRCQSATNEHLDLRLDEPRLSAAKETAGGCGFGTKKVMNPSGPATPTVPDQGLANTGKTASNISVNYGRQRECTAITAVQIPAHYAPNHSLQKNQQARSSICDARTMIPTTTHFDVLASL